MAIAGLRWVKYSLEGPCVLPSRLRVLLAFTAAVASVVPLGLVKPQSRGLEPGVAVAVKEEAPRM